MRKLFSSQGLALVSAVVCAFVLNIFMSNFFTSNQSQMSVVIKEWLSHLLNL